MNEKDNIGHYAVIVHYNKENNKVLIADPEWNNEDEKFWECSIENIYNSCCTYDNRCKINRGFILLKNI